MKTKQLLIMVILIAGSMLTVHAQTNLIEEEFSSTEWETELNHLNPGLDDFGVPINANATNTVAYTTPTTMGGGGAYQNLNGVDLYFGKYRLSGAIEVLETGLCSHGYVHSNPTTGTAVAFRFTNPGGKFEMPELPSVGTVTVHVKNGNTTNDCNLVLEKYNALDDSWEVIDSYLLRRRNQLKNENDEALLDEALSIDVNSATPLKIRLHNYKIGDLNTRFLNMYRVEVSDYIINAVQKLQLEGLKQQGRTIIVDEPVQITLYNTMGKLLLNEFVKNKLLVPATMGKGVFVLKTEKGNQKVVFN